MKFLIGDFVCCYGSRPHNQLQAPSYTLKCLYVYVFVRAGKGCACPLLFYVVCCITLLLIRKIHLIPYPSITISTSPLIEVVSLFFSSLPATRRERIGLSSIRTCGLRRTQPVVSKHRTFI